MPAEHPRDEYEYKVTAMRPAEVQQTADEHMNFAAEDGWRLVEVIVLMPLEQASFIWERKKR
ncbi:MAG: hypothetical protein M3T56_00630 [Chloroflexota bacterium]|nr:hypothetical protein [Chloroflexota bacterium]